ncbi:MAG: nuclease [Symploca sp. SIO1C4]|uniref:Nuclease n=1 Tax=Symploca sp. SIO1C4 TaxID=2607765 RepID=A0A6B3NM05_9CYAN|nr:nuclease [Symploca sp. SIO1C4]NET03735.1 nuclease [Symploca sp. SIO2B6]
MGEIINQLQQVSEGLLWISESEYPFEVYWWEQNSITPEKLLQLTNHPPDLPVKIIGIDQFFKRVITPTDWHNQKERTTIKRYQTLVDTLKIYLSDIQVYRVGEVEVDIYIVGSTKLGNLVGLYTKSVET